ncbi:MAG: hexokinase [Tannerellaceae bacterium]|jgi:hexokinase|nr:hexokinase [Tannerellaceae bacterium]
MREEKAIVARKNVFELNDEQLADVAKTLQERIEEGLCKNNQEVQCIPTFIQPRTANLEGQALVLDLGGTNYRVASVEFHNGKTIIRPENGLKKDLSAMKTPGFTETQLFEEQAALIKKLKRNKDLPIGYCFSYPAESLPDGDAKVLRWTKGVNIPSMVGEPIGKPLVDYLNRETSPGFTGAKVINDTIASLFAGLTRSDYDAYIGLIVGTGTNMATFIPAGKIPKLDGNIPKDGLIPINFESGNFRPPYLTFVDRIVDALSDNKGAQRFEKAVAGMYLGEIMKACYPHISFEKKFDAERLANIVDYPGIYAPEYVHIARSIYLRSAQLVGAAIAGVVHLLRSYNPSIRRVRVMAEGSLFWSGSEHGGGYKEAVEYAMRSVLLELKQEGNVTVDIHREDNANLIGSAIAALS